jgi:membrane protein YdbS with pleckstrin-like domain
VDFLRPSPRLWTARLLVWAGASAVALTVSTGAAGWMVGRTLAAAVAVGVAVVAGLWLWMLRGRYRAWGYLERDDDLLVRRGVLIRRLSVVPYGRMQFLDVTAGPVDRWLGLATVQLHTAAAATDAHIPGLTSADAGKLRDRLATLGEARAAGL